MVFKKHSRPLHLRLDCKKTIRIVCFIMYDAQLRKKFHCFFVESTDDGKSLMRSCHLIDRTPLGFPNCYRFGVRLRMNNSVSPPSKNDAMITPKTVVHTLLVGTILTIPKNNTKSVTIQLTREKGPHFFRVIITTPHMKKKIPRSSDPWFVNYFSKAVCVVPSLPVCP